MRIVEPILFEGVSHLIVNINTQENEELNLAFAHDEGALIIACRANFAEGDKTTFVDQNGILSAALRTTNAVAASINGLVVSPDTLWMRNLHVQGVLDTAVGGQFEYYFETDWQELPGGGVVIASNPFAEFRNTDALQMSLGIAFKRVIFDDDELVRFVALRRR